MQIRGNLPCVLEADQWGRLLAAPLTILEEFQAVAEEVRRAGTVATRLLQVLSCAPTGTDPGQLARVRAAEPEDIRTFYKEKMAEFDISRCCCVLCVVYWLSAAAFIAFSSFHLASFQ